MMHQTHHFGGLIAAEITLIYFGQSPFSLITPVALVGGYILGAAADIDKPESYIGQKMSLLAHALQILRVRHRTLTHSLLMTLLIWMLFNSLNLPNVLVISFTAAYASHWILDLFNEQGVELFWPLPIRIKILPAILAIGTDSVAELIIRKILNVMHYFLLFVLVKPYLLHVPVIGSGVSWIWNGFVNVLPSFMTKYF